MICYIIGSTQQSEQGSKVLHTIAQALSDNQVTLVHEHALPPVYEEASRAIGRADIVIADATQHTFDQGFLISLSLQHKRPTLLLFKGKVTAPLVTSIVDRNLTVKTYSKISELASVIKQFIDKNTVAANDLRFNFFISKDMHTYLKDMAHATGKNKSEIVRDLLEKEIRNHDT